MGQGCLTSLPKQELRSSKWSQEVSGSKWRGEAAFSHNTIKPRNLQHAVVHCGYFTFISIQLLIRQICFLCPHSSLGDKYWVFKEVTAEPGYPHSVVELGSCLPREGIDTALRWEPVGKTYFFKGDRYWRYNEDKRATDPGYPKPITVWRGIPQAPQGAFISKEGCMYLQSLCLLDR